MNLFELFVKIGVDDQASDKIKKVGDTAEKTAKGGLSNFASKLGSGIATAAKIGAAAVGAAATSIAALTTAAVNNYAEYEQLVGGVQTLFGLQGQSLEEYAATVGKTTDEALDEWLKYTTGERKILNNAEIAYKTAGLSMNEYMETVTSFSASLIQSLDGDTAKAADYADQAIRDMSDNANKMGTSMEMIQNAYQGFAKQNYTMLDNLKLGYGGTKEEMQRLLKDAEKLSGQKFDISSYADIVDAIHVVQTEMGITGTTAKEAATTISGSVSSMKSAWSNLVTGLADDEADFGTLMDNFVGSVKTAAENIAPRIGTALNGVAKLIQEIVPVAMQYIPQIITEFLPTIADSAVGIVSSIGTAIFDNIDQILEFGQQMLDSLLSGITNNVDSISGPVTEIITKFANFIAENLPEIIMAGINILGSLLEGIIKAIPELATAATKAVIELASYILRVENLEKILAVGGDLIDSLAEGIANSLDLLVEAGANVVESIKQGISNAWDGIVSWFNGIWDSLFGNRSVNVNANVSTNGSHAGGLAYVPFDGYIAELHKGERVLTANEAKDYNNSEKSSGGGVTVVQNIYSQAKTAADLMQEALYQQERAVILGV